MGRIQYMILGIVTLTTINLVSGQTPSTPTADNNRPIYTYFPDNLVCDEAIEGDGLSIGLVTIGDTTLQEIEEVYSDYFEVSVEYFEAAGETLIYLYRLDDGTIYQRIDVCVLDDVVIASDDAFPSSTQLEELDTDHIEGIGIPVSFELVGIRQYVSRYGVPDVVTFSTSRNHRIAFWFEYGIAAEFYVVFDPPDTEYPLGFGSLSRVIYFPFENLDGYETRWPFNQTYPEERYVSQTAPYLAIDVPTERNPFDFDSMFATMTAEPRRTPTPQLVATATP